MKKPIIIKKKINKFVSKISVDGDKSISIRFLLLASQAIGKSRAFNLLVSDDVKNTISCLRRLGVKIKIYGNFCEVYGNGLNSYKYKKNCTLNAGNSGTLARLILGLLIKSNQKIKIKGDSSLSKRDFLRVINPLQKFGAKFFPKNKNNLPLSIIGNRFIRPIKYKVKIPSAQVKSSLMFGALNSPGKTCIIAKRSRDHSENLFKYLKIPIKIKKNKEYDYIEIEGQKQFKSFNYKIPSDISSCAFFIVLTLLSEKSELLIKNVNVNPRRAGIINILNKMGAGIKLYNKKKYFGEDVANIYVKSKKKLKGFNCPAIYNSSAIDEFLIIFLVAAKSKGISFFKDLSELNKKESPRLKLGSQILNMIGIKTALTENSLKIYGNPKLDLKKNYVIKNYLKDHRIFMMCTTAALALGGNWKIYDPDSINSSFPNFIKITKKLGAKIYQ